MYNDFTTNVEADVQIFRSNRNRPGTSSLVFNRVHRREGAHSMQKAMERRGGALQKQIRPTSSAARQLHPLLKSCTFWVLNCNSQALTKSHMETSCVARCREKCGKCGEDVGVVGGDAEWGAGGGLSVEIAVATVLVVVATCHDGGGGGGRGLWW
jgi:hypothetical protein